MVASLAGAGVHVDGGGVESGDFVQQLMLGLYSDRVPFADAQSVVDGDVSLRPQPVSQPPQSDDVDAPYAGNRAERFLGGVDELWLNRIHESAVDVPGRTSEHQQDCHRNEQT